MVSAALLDLLKESYYKGIIEELRWDFTIGIQRRVVMTEHRYEVVWPLGKSAYQAVPPTRRISDLSDKTVCELWDWLFRGNELFPIVRESLAKRYPGINFVDYTVFGNIHGQGEAEVIAALPDLLREHGCDAVISAVGA